MATLKTIPLVPFKVSMLKRISRPFASVSDVFEKMFPDFELQLSQAELEIEARDYFAIAVFSALFWFALLFGTVFTLAVLLTEQTYLLITLASSSIIAAMVFFYVMNYPKLIIVRKLRDLDKNLLYSLRDLSVQIKSGVPMFDAMVSISRKDYGRISEEFRIGVKKISTGMSAPDALEDMALKNPSLNFRRSIWQMVNSIRSGTDLGNTLDNVVNNISREQQVQIKKYGAQLNPLAMMYMMVGVILPSLGITFLIILSSFSGFPVTEWVFWGILLVLTVFQIAFIGIVKSRRPSIEI